MSLYSCPLMGSFSPSFTPSTSFWARCRSSSSAYFWMALGSMNTVSAEADTARFTPLRSRIAPREAEMTVERICWLEAPSWSSLCWVMVSS